MEILLQGKAERTSSFVLYGTLRASLVRKFSKFIIKTQVKDGNR